MFEFPRAAQPLMGSLSITFTKPTFKRCTTLLVGAVLAQGRRTLTEIQWAVFGLVPGHFSSFHRVFSRARWSLWPPGKALARHALRLVPEGQPVLVPMDDTVTRYSGPKIHDRGCHRDALQPRDHHALLGTSMGGAGDPRQTAADLTSVGVAGAVRVVCFARGGGGRGPTVQDAL